MGASVSTLGSGTTIPATPAELELQAQLAAARAQIDALRAQQERQQSGVVDPGRDRALRRMDANLWDKPILKDPLQNSLFDGLKV